MPDGVLNIDRGRLDLSLLAHGLQKHECVSTASCKLDNRYYGIRLMVQHTKLAIRYNHEAALSPRLEIRKPITGSLYVDSAPFLFVTRGGGGQM